MTKRLLRLLLHAPPPEPNALSLRRWFLFFLTFLSLVAGIAVLSLRAYDTNGAALALKAALLALYVFYLSLCCTFFPGPTIWIIMLLASPVVALIPPDTVVHLTHAGPQAAQLIADLLTILIVASLGALGSAIGNLNEYHLFTFLLRFGRVGAVRQTRFYRRAQHWFAVSPFLLVAFFNFLPIPVDAVRWLAIAHRYSRRRFALASFLGRFPRYALLAAAATALKLGLLHILLVQLAFFALVALSYLPRLLPSQRLQTSTQPSESDYNSNRTPSVSAGPNSEPQA